MKCQAWIKQTAFYGKADTVKCQKDATHMDENGRYLCGNHFKKWIRKIIKRNINKH